MRRASLQLYAKHLDHQTAQADREVAQAKDELERRQDALSQLEQAQEQAQAQAQEQAKEGISVALWRLHAQTITHMTQEQTRCQQEIEQAQRELLDAQQRRHEAFHEEQRMERVISRVDVNARQRKVRREDRELDELANAVGAASQQKPRR